MESLVDGRLLLARSGNPDFIKREWVDVTYSLPSPSTGSRSWPIPIGRSTTCPADGFGPIGTCSQSNQPSAAHAVQSIKHRDVISLGAAWAESRPPTPRLGTSRIPHQPRSRLLGGFDSGCGLWTLRIKNGLGTHLPRSECLANVWEEGWDWPSSKL